MLLLKLIIAIVIIDIRTCNLLLRRFSDSGTDSRIRIGSNGFDRIWARQLNQGSVPWSFIFPIRTVSTRTSQTHSS